jgi:zinc and cadmium transporter
MLIIILSACLVIMLASLSGVFFLVEIIRSWTEKNLKYLLSFSAGIFLVVVYNLGIEATEHSPTIGIIAMIAGVVTIHIITKMWPEFHHHHENDHNHSHSFAGAQRILISDAFHNIGDGILVASTFLVNIHLGIVTTVSIFIHELVEEISEYFVMREAGLSTFRALSLNFATSSTIIIGAVFGYFFASTEFINSMLLGFAGGSFLYILMIDLIPKSVKNVRTDKTFFKHLAWVIVGLAVITITNTFLIDDHSVSHLENTIQSE